MIGRLYIHERVPISYLFWIDWKKMKKKIKKETARRKEMRNFLHKFFFYLKKGQRQ